jgi:hypothetical protein
LLSSVRYIAQSPLVHLIFAYLFSVTNPLTPLYCIHDEDTNILNDFILLSRGNVSQMAAEKNELGEELFKRRAHPITRA